MLPLHALQAARTLRGLEMVVLLQVGDVKIEIKCFIYLFIYPEEGEGVTPKDIAE